MILRLADAEHNSVQESVHAISVGSPQPENEAKYLPQLKITTTCLSITPAEWST